MINSSICLIGPMAAGKSTVGKALAVHLGMPFFDSDDILQQQYGLPIHEIFTRYGEEYFRQQEEVVIKQALRRPQIVLATGGGSIVSNSTRTTLMYNTVVCYLQATPLVQMQRLHADQTRPLLQRSTDRLQTLQNLADRRDCLYAEIADIIVDTVDCSIEQLVLQLSSLLQEHAFN